MQIVMSSIYTCSLFRVLWGATSSVCIVFLIVAKEFVKYEITWLILSLMKIYLFVITFSTTYIEIRNPCLPQTMSTCYLCFRSTWLYIFLKVVLSTFILLWMTIIDTKVKVSVVSIIDSYFSFIGFLYDI